MSKSNVVRAWKDEKFRRSLSVEEQALLPANPVGRVELSDAQLCSSGAGKTPPQTAICTILCTWGPECPSSWCSFAECPTEVIECPTQVFCTIKP